MSAARDPDLQELLDALMDGLAAKVEPGSAAAGALARVQAAVADAREGAPSPRSDEPPVACQHLEAALTNAKAAGGPAARAAAAMEKLGDRIVWYRRQGLEAGAEPGFPEKHALASLIGPADRAGSLETRDDLRVGISLVAPGASYPDHQHPPEELYLALTKGDWRQDRGPWFSPGPGGIVYNTSNIFHGMRAADEPQLALWCLPIP
jgi:quercetin dioxygenase-like cupin family protein